MKKLFLIGLIVSLCATGSYAQSRAIGLRLSNSFEVSYQMDAGSSNFWEFDGGMWYWGRGCQATALYNWILASPRWSSRGDWNWYAGVGGSLGFIWANRYHHGNEDLGCFVGVAGICGLEYNFWFPLNVSVDFRPVVGPYFGDGVWFNTDVFVSAFYPTISARYIF